MVVLPTEEPAGVLLRTFSAGSGHTCPRARWDERWVVVDKDGEKASPRALSGAGTCPRTWLHPCIERKHTRSSRKLRVHRRQCQALPCRRPTGSGEGMALLAQGIPFAYGHFVLWCPETRLPQTCFSSPLPLHVCGQAAMLAQRGSTTATRPLVMRAGRKPYQLQKGASGREEWRGRKGFHGWGETPSAETNSRTWRRIEA